MILVKQEILADSDNSGISETDFTHSFVTADEDKKISIKKEPTLSEMIMEEIIIEPEIIIKPEMDNEHGEDNDEAIIEDISWDKISDRIVVKQESNKPMLIESNRLYINELDECEQNILIENDVEENNATSSEKDEAQNVAKGKGKSIISKPKFKMIGSLIFEEIGSKKGSTKRKNKKDSIIGVDSKAVEKALQYPDDRQVKGRRRIYTEASTPLSTSKNRLKLRYQMSENLKYALQALNMGASYTTVSRACGISYQRLKRIKFLEEEYPALVNLHPLIIEDNSETIIVKEELVQDSVESNIPEINFFDSFITANDDEEINIKGESSTNHNAMEEIIIRQEIIQYKEYKDDNGETIIIEEILSDKVSEEIFVRQEPDENIDEVILVDQTGQKNLKNINFINKPMLIESDRLYLNELNDGEEYVNDKVEGVDNVKTNKLTFKPKSMVKDSKLLEEIIETGKTPKKTPHNVVTPNRKRLETLKGRYTQNASKGKGKSSKSPDRMQMKIDKEGRAQLKDKCKLTYRMTANLKLALQAIDRGEKMDEVVKAYGISSLRLQKIKNMEKQVPALVHYRNSLQRGLNSKHKISSGTSDIKVKKTK